MAVSCKDYSEDINGLESRISALEGQIQKLQAAVDAGAILQSVEKTDYGWLIKTNKGDYQVYNGVDGEDGKDGVDGKDGSVITIGDNGHWFIDGNDTGLQAKGQDGKDGKDGVDGKDGKDGKDGSVITIGDNGNWFIDGNDTGIYAGDAAATRPYVVVTDEKIEFYNLKDADGNLVEPNPTVIYLGQKLSSLVFIPENYVDGVEAIVGETLAFYPLHTLKSDSPEESFVFEDDAQFGEEAPSEDLEPVIIDKAVYAKYHVNPAHAVIDPEKDTLIAVLQPNANYYQTRAEAKDLKVSFEYVDRIGDTLVVKVNVEGEPATGEKISVVALNVVSKEDAEKDVTSDYATLYKDQIAMMFVAEPQESAEKYNHKSPWHEEFGLEHNHYRAFGIPYYESYDGFGMSYRIGEVLWEEKDLPYEELQTTCDTTVLITGNLDLNAIATGHAIREAKLFSGTVTSDDIWAALYGYDIDTKKKDGTCVEDPKILEDFGLSMKFELVKNYGAWEDVTLEDGILTPDAKAVGKAVIIRTWIVDSEGRNVNGAYIKVFCGIDNTPVVVDADPVDFDCEEREVVTTAEDLSKVYEKYGLKAEEFHARFSTFIDKDVQNQEEGVIGNIADVEEGGKHVLQWTLPMDSVYAHIGETITHDVQYVDETGVPANVTVSLVINDFDNVRVAYPIAEYWNPDYTETYFNVNVPQTTTDDDPDHALFENNPNASFFQISNSDQHLDFSKADADDKDVIDLTYTFYKPYYDPDGDGVDSLVMDLKYYYTEWTYNTSGNPVSYVVKENTEKAPLKVAFILEDEFTLAARVWDAEAGAFGEKETIITIVNSEEGGRLNSIYLDKTSAVADTLLNTNDLRIALGALGYLCGDERYPADILFGRPGEDTAEEFFIAKYRMPVEIASKSGKNFIDAVDYGEVGSWMRLEDLLDPYDWRGRLFSAYENYWGYYGPFDITADIENATCNLGGDDTFSTVIPNTIELKQLEPAEGQSDWDPTNYGYLTYKNNGTHVKDFQIKMPVKVSYGFGTITANVYITVKETIGAPAPGK